MNCNLEWNNTHLTLSLPGCWDERCVVAIQTESVWMNTVNKIIIKKDYDKRMDLLFVQEVDADRIEAYVSKQTICLTKGHLKTTQ